MERAGLHADSAELQRSYVEERFEHDEEVLALMKVTRE